MQNKTAIIKKAGLFWDLDIQEKNSKNKKNRSAFKKGQKAKRALKRQVKRELINQIAYEVTI